MNSTRKKQSLTSAKQTTSSNSNFELVKRTEIADSPFIVITTEEGSCGVMGNYRLTEIYATEQEAIDEVQKITWNNIIRVVSCILHREISNPFINS